MPAHKRYDLDPYYHDIELRLAAAWTQDRVLTWLEEKMEEAPSKITLKRALRTWGLTSVKHQNRPNDQSQGSGSGLG
jgi:hypothetical protein